MKEIKQTVLSLFVGVFLVFSAAPTSLMGDAFSIPSQYKPYVALKHLEFKAKDVEYCYKIRGTSSRTEVVSLAKEGLSEVFEILYSALPEESVESVKENVFNTLQNAITSLDSIEDESRMEETINEAFSELKSDDSASYKKMTSYACSAAMSIIDTAINRLGE